MMGQRFFSFLVFFFLSLGLGALPTYHRIASVTLMGDEFLSQLVPSSQILAYSRLADDPTLSNIRGAASQVKDRAWLNLEQLLRLKADLVVAADWSDKSLLDYLKEKKIAVYIIVTPHSWAEVRLRVKELSAFLGQKEAGEKLLASLDERERELKSLVSRVNQKKSLLEYSSLGTSMGRGTLWNDVCTLAGVDNLAADLPTDAFGYAPLSKEVLLRLDPDYLVLPSEAALRSYGKASFVKDLQADGLFQALKAVKTQHLIFLSESLKTTASPFALDAAFGVFHAAYPDLR